MVSKTSVEGCSDVSVGRNGMSGLPLFIGVPSSVDDTSIVPVGCVYALERLAEGPERGNHFFVSNIEILKVVGQPADQREEHVGTHSDCGSELMDHVGARGFA
jgi:hypothetical protein